MTPVAPGPPARPGIARETLPGSGIGVKCCLETKIKIGRVVVGYPSHRAMRVKEYERRGVSALLSEQTLVHYNT